MTKKLQFIAILYKSVQKGDRNSHAQKARTPRSRFKILYTRANVRAFSQLTFCLIR